MCNGGTQISLGSKKIAAASHFLFQYLIEDLALVRMHFASALDGFRKGSVVMTVVQYNYCGSTATGYSSVAHSVQATAENVSEDQSSVPSM